ncbi:MAG: 50S ribosomal protein L30 [Chloroflexi bacterium]|nr:50S ribosomal protein L30 [Chloroflexota bacterium]
MAETPASLRITLVRSPIGNTERQKATARALGLRRLNQVVDQPDNPAVRGMIFRIQHLLRVESATEGRDQGPSTKGKRDEHA